MVYAVSRGGTVQGQNGANSNIALMSAVGSCGQIAAGSAIVVNELTTVAAMYALNQFYVSATAIGASATNATGMSNAFQAAATLADVVKGSSPGPMLPGNAGSPAVRMNTVANILNSCVASASKCSALYAAAGVAATNTLDVGYTIARNPGKNIGALYRVASGISAYGPYLSGPPADWSMFLVLTGAGLSAPTGVAIDSTGSVWVANYNGVASKFGTTGAAVFANGVTGSGLNNSYGAAVDLHDNAWIPNEQPYKDQNTIGSVSVLTSNGSSAAGTGGFTAGGLFYPISIALDPNGTAWVLDYGNSHLTLLDASGAPISGATGYVSKDFAFPVTVAIDGNHVGWVGNLSSTKVTRVSADGNRSTNFEAGGLGVAWLAMDQKNNIWTSNYYSDSVSVLANDGSAIAQGLTAGGSISHPEGIAVDGAGNVWIANYLGTFITELSGVTGGNPGAALTPVTGIGADAKLLLPYNVAIDASGNLWLSNKGNDTVVKFIGLATPVKTPLSLLPQAP